MTQKTRNEIRENHISRLQEKYNTLQKEYKALKNNFESLIDISIDVVFNEFNDDVELLARKLYKLGIIERDDNTYIFPKNRNIKIRSASAVDRKEVEKDE